MVADSYYFELDHPSGTPGGIAAVHASLHALLRQWRTCVEALENEATVALPFDYSDQYTGVVVVTRRGELLDIAPGFTNVEGWAHYPSDLPSFHEREPRITTDEARKVAAPRSAFLGALDRSLSAIASIRTQETKG
jgi:hypothetical protein